MKKGGRGQRLIKIALDGGRGPKTWLITFPGHPMENWPIPNGEVPRPQSNGPPRSQHAPYAELSAV
jgi:hypothetical protein